MQNNSLKYFSSLQGYRYSYNGMEKDNEVSGNGNSYTTQFRQYDPRLGRWKSLDPLAGKFPDLSPFAAFNNNPVYFIDPLGLEGIGPKGKGGSRHGRNKLAGKNRDKKEKSDGGDDPENPDEKRTKLGFRFFSFHLIPKPESGIGSKTGERKKSEAEFSKDHSNRWEKLSNEEVEAYKAEKKSWQLRLVSFDIPKYEREQIQFDELTYPDDVDPTSWKGSQYRTVALTIEEKSNLIEKGYYLYSFVSVGEIKIKWDYKTPDKKNKIVVNYGETPYVQNDYTAFKGSHKIQSSEGVNESVEGTIKVFIPLKELQSEADPRASDQFIIKIIYQQENGTRKQWRLRWVKEAVIE